MDIKVKLINGGKIPQKQHKNDACFDCYANESVLIDKGKTVKIQLGFAVQLPENFEAQIRPRSGLSCKGIQAQLGTVDENFRGEVAAIIYNASGEDFLVNKGDRICQMAIRMTMIPSSLFELRHSSIFSAIEYMCTQNLVEVQELDNTERGENGFGSSGIS